MKVPELLQYTYFAQLTNSIPVSTPRVPKCSRNFRFSDYNSWCSAYHAVHDTYLDHVVFHYLPQFNKILRE
jgi:hypothetical protein